MEPPRWEDPMSNTTASQALLPLSSALTALVRDTGRCVVEVHSNRSRASGWFWRPHWVVTAGERIELDIALRASAEGCIVVDARGGAIGMAIFGPRKRVLVIPAATIERVASQLERDGRVARGYLGLGLQPVRLQSGGEGAMVM